MIPRDADPTRQREYARQRTQAAAEAVRKYRDRWKQWTPLVTGVFVITLLNALLAAWQTAGAQAAYVVGGLVAVLTLLVSLLTSTYNTIRGRVRHGEECMGKLAQLVDDLNRSDWRFDDWLERFRGIEDRYFPALVYFRAEQTSEEQQVPPTTLVKPGGASHSPIAE